MQPDTPVVRSIAARFIALYRLDVDTVDELVNQTFIRVIQHLYDNKQDVLRDKNKFSRYYITAVANRLKNYIKWEAKKSPRVFSDVFDGTNFNYIPGEEKTGDLAIIKNPAIIDYIGGLSKKRWKRKKILHEAYELFGDEIFKVIAAVKMSSGVIPTARIINHELEENMKQNITRAEYEYVIRLAGSKERMGLYIDTSPDSMSQNFIDRIRLWISTNGSVIDAPTDCFGVARVESNVACQSCGVSVDCKKAMEIFLKEDADRQKEALTVSTTIVKRNATAESLWDNFQGNLLPAHIEVKERSRVGLKLADNLFYRGKDLRGWLFCWWSVNPPLWLDKVTIIEQKARSIHFVVPDIDKFMEEVKKFNK